MSSRPGSFTMKAGSRVYHLTHQCSLYPPSKFLCYFTLPMPTRLAAVYDEVDSSSCSWLRGLWMLTFSVAADLRSLVWALLSALASLHAICSLWVMGALQVAFYSSIVSPQSTLDPSLWQFHWLYSCVLFIIMSAVRCAVKKTVNFMTYHVQNFIRLKVLKLLKQATYWRCSPPIRHLGTSRVGGFFHAKKSYSDRCWKASEIKHPLGVRLVMLLISELEVQLFLHLRLTNHVFTVVEMLRSRMSCVQMRLRRTFVVAFPAQKLCWRQANCCCCCL